MIDNSLKNILDSIERLDQLSMLDRIASELQISLDTLNKIRTINGIPQQGVIDSIEHGEEPDTLLQSLLSLQEDISIVEAITNLQQQEVVYQTVLEITTRTLTTINLFDLT